MEVCQDILTRLETDPNLLGRTITGDESWIFEYDPFTKRQSLEWKSPMSPRPKKARMSKSKVKSDVDHFLCCEGNCSQRVLTSRPNHQSAHLQRHSAVFDAVSA